MDTKEVAQQLETSARTLRQFLRSPLSTFVPVGSGGRYDFTERELPTIAKRFAEWQSAGKPRPTANGKSKPKINRVSARVKQREQDEATWQEEGSVVIEDIRDPRVRVRVRADAEAAENRLMEMLIAKGLHVFQSGNVTRKSS